MNFNEKRRLVDEIANTIFVEEKGSDPHWIAKAKELFTFFALYDICTKNESTFFDIARANNKDYKPLIVKESPFYNQAFSVDEKTGKVTPNEGVNFQNLYFHQCGEQRFTDVNNPKNWEMAEDALLIPKDGEELLDIIVRDYARGLAAIGDEEFGSVKSTFNRVMSVFTSYQVRDATDEMSFEYEDLRRKNITLYIKIAQTDIDTLKSLIRVLLESIAKNLMTREAKRKEERIYLVLDEFVRFGVMPFLLEMPALCRSYGLVPLYITQSYGLIKEYYGEDKLKTMIDTIAFQILFKMNDIDSAENVSRQIGKYTRENRSYSTGQNTIMFGGSSSYSLEGTELVTAQDILNIDSKEIIVLVTGHKAKPIKLEAGYYFNDSNSTKKLNWKFDPTNKEAKKYNQVKEEKPPKPQAQIAPTNDTKDTKQDESITESQAPQAEATPQPELTPDQKQAQIDKAYEEQLQEDALKNEVLAENQERLFDMAMKGLSEEEINAEIEKLLIEKRKEYEYVCSIDDKIITAKIKHSKAIGEKDNKVIVPLGIAKKVIKETNKLTTHAGFTTYFTNEHLWRQEEIRQQIRAQDNNPIMQAQKAQEQALEEGYLAIFDKAKTTKEKLNKKLEIDNNTTQEAQEQTQPSNQEKNASVSNDSSMPKQESSESNIETQPIPNSYPNPRHKTLTTIEKQEIAREVSVELEDRMQALMQAQMEKFAAMLANQNQSNQSSKVSQTDNTNQSNNKGD